MKNNMKYKKSLILDNEEIAGGIFKMTLESEGQEFDSPGQFAMIDIPGKFLRRPISVSSFDSERYTLIYKVVGEGTDILSKMERNRNIDVITGLGTGYDLNKIPDDATLVGGGIGIPPLLSLVKNLIMQGKRCKVILGYNTKEEIFLKDEFSNFARELKIITRDGSFGDKGLVTDLIDNEKYICSCGPIGMLKEVAKKANAGQFSLEARMGCGFGVCMGCSILTKNGSKRICKEGPVFDKEELLWENL